MGNFLELLYDVLFHPSVAMRTISVAPKVGQSVAAFLLSVLIPAGSMYFGFKSAEMSLWGNLLLVIQVVGSFLLWWFGAAILHLIAELLGGQGRAVGLLACMGFGYLPRIFIVPFWVVSALLPVAIRPILFTVSAIVVSVWTLTLHVIAIREAHQLTTAKATLVLISPLLLIIALVFGLFILIGSTFNLPFSFIL